mmetsp:Transcript_10669/g.19465  ORF Transcript_10669/g.19465 Transcript_10669/m.19465 type:complete len:212 (+) Transcript_10669:1665-2300(+)
MNEGRPKHVRYFPTVRMYQCFGGTRIPQFRHKMQDCHAIGGACHLHQFGRCPSHYNMLHRIIIILIFILTHQCQGMRRCSLQYCIIGISRKDRGTRPHSILLVWCCLTIHRMIRWDHSKNGGRGICHGVILTTIVLQQSRISNDHVILFGKGYTHNTTQGPSMSCNAHKTGHIMESSLDKFPRPVQWINKNNQLLHRYIIITQTRKRGMVL